MNIKGELLKYSDNIFIKDLEKGISLTYKEFLILASNLECFLNLESIPEKLVVQKQNSLELALLYFWALFRKVKIFPLSVKYSAKFVESICKKINSDFILNDDFSLNKDELLNFLKNKKHSKDDFIKTLDIILKNIDEPLFHFFSSGTTEEPKCIIHRFSDFYKNGKIFILYHKIQPSDRFTTLLDMTYMAGFYNMFLIPFFSGASTVIRKSFQIKDIFNFWEYVVSNNVNILWLVPTIIKLLNDFEKSKYMKLVEKKIKLIFSCTAPLPLNEKIKFRKKYNKKIFNTYGLSETLFVSSEREDNYLEKDFYVGQPLIDVKINTKNELVIKNSDEFFVGYLKNNEVIPAPSEFSTKDIAKLENNCLFIFGRSDDLIIKAGINISPSILENILRNLNFLKDCAVVGIEDSKIGNKVVAFLVLKEKAFEKKKILSLINKTIKEKYYKIDIIDDVVVLDNIPKNINMKVDKKKLWEIYRNHILKEK